jgi:hypothetical protein
MVVQLAKAQENYVETAEKFQRFYNEQTPDSIFLLYDPALKEKLTPEKTRAVINGLHIQYGDLKTLNLLKQDSGFNMYKAVFAHQTLTLLLALTNENLIAGYRLVPYSPDQLTENKDSKK